MRFWDSSAVVPLLIRERASERLKRAFAERGAKIVWWATPIECTSAIVRRERAGELQPAESLTAQSRLRRLMSAVIEVQPSDMVGTLSQRLLRVHDLRASDALQLAAALAGPERDTPAIEMVCLDRRLILAAEREGLRILG